MGLFAKKPMSEEGQEEFITPRVLEKMEPEQIAEEETLVETDEEVIEVAEETPVEEKQEIVNTFSDEMGIVAAGTIIRGDIKTKGHLAIVGVVEGNVVASGNVMLTGVVKGEIDCNNIIIDGTDYNNCIRAKGSVSVKSNTSVSGQIFCKHISVNGTVMGTIKATGNVGLTKDCVVRGDVSAAILAVEPGAKISGNVSVK